jgi:hypothetical protein
MDNCLTNNSSISYAIKKPTNLKIRHLKKTTILGKKFSLRLYYSNYKKIKLNQKQFRIILNIIQYKQKNPDKINQKFDLPRKFIAFQAIIPQILHLSLTL